MNSNIFRQYDSRWASLPYPVKSSSFGGNGCGCCACTHVIIERAKYKNYTPADVRPYMVSQGFAVAGQGTLWSGITKTLQHYGFKVINHDTMPDLWKTLNARKKAGKKCMGVILFRAGSRGGITFTSCGHYIAFVNYKVENGKHYLYLKDSGARMHDGWYCYETQMKGLIPQIWSAILKLNKKTTTTTAKAVKLGQACADYDHKAGDSSGKEVVKTAFKYSASSTSPFNWTYVFRPKDSAKAEKAASMCEKAIANNNIGYNSHGETAYGKDKAMTKLAKDANYDLSKVKTKCGLSCGDLICLCNRYAGLSTCYIGSGLQLANKYSKSANFTRLPYKKGMALKRGDVLITAHSNGKNNHVAMVL